LAWNEVATPSVEKSFIPSVNSHPQPTIAILMPHRGRIHMEVESKTWGPLRYQRSDWCNKMYFLCRAPSLPLARNTLVKEALNSEAAFFLWVDSDHVPEEPKNIHDAVKELWKCLEETGESIVTGLYRAKQIHGFNYAIWKEAPPWLCDKLG